MQRANHLAVFEIPFGQVGIGVGADVVAGVQLTVQVDQQNFFRPNPHRNHVARGDVAERGDFDKFVSHRDFPPWELYH